MRKGRCVLMVLAAFLVGVPPTAHAQEATTTTAFSENPALRIVRKSVPLRRSEVRLAPQIVSEISGSPIGSGASGDAIGTSQISEAERLASELGARSTAEGLLVSLSERVLFDFDKADLRPDARQVLEKVASIIKVRTGLVTISGHTDDTGSDAYNQQLSERRANAVKDELESLGVDPARLQASGFGETQPIAPNDTDQNRQMNRRVDIVIA